MNDLFGELIRENFYEAAKQTLEEIESDPLLQNMELPPNLKEKIYAAIEEREEKVIKKRPESQTFLVLVFSSAAGRGKIFFDSSLPR